MTSQADPTARPPRRWTDKFREAFRGLKYGMRGQSSFAVHIFMACAVIAAAAAFRCTAEEWCLLVFAIGLVLTAEFINSSIETLFRGLDSETREKSWKCLDIAAGAVLTASATAVVIGVVIFGRRLWTLFDGSP